MALTLTNLQRHDSGDQTKITGALAFDASYATGGETLTASLLGLDRIEDMQFEDSEGYTYDADIAAGGATALIKAYRTGATTVALATENAHTHANDTMALTTPALTGSSAAGTSHNHAFTGTAFAAATANVIYNATPATLGTAVYACVKDGKMEEAILASENANGATATLETDEGLTTFVVYKPLDAHEVHVMYDNTPQDVVLYVRLDANGQTGHLEFVSPTNAHGSFTCNNGGDTVAVIDNDNAAAGTIQLYCDDDATDGDRLQVNNPFGVDVYLRTNTGRYLKLKHNTSASGDGVPVYFEEAAANSYERLNGNLAGAGDIDNTNDSAAAWTAVTGEAVTLVYFDDDGATAEQKFLHAAASTADLFVPFIDLTDPTVSPRLLTIAYDAAAAATGDQLYYDDDGATADERLVCLNSGTSANATDSLSSSIRYYDTVSAGANAAENAHTHPIGTYAITDASIAGNTAAGSAHTHTATATAAAMAEVGAGVDLSAITINFEALGR